MRGTRRRARLAVSIIVSNLLVSVAVISLSTMLAAWAIPAVLQFEGTISTWFGRTNEQLTEAFVIEAVQFLSTQTNITVRNIGTRDIEIVTVLIDGVSYSLAPSPGFVSAPPPGLILLAVGQTVKIIIPRSAFNWTPKKPVDPPYFIKVVSSRGNENTGEKFWVPR